MKKIFFISSFVFCICLFVERKIDNFEQPIQSPNAIAGTPYGFYHSSENTIKNCTFHGHSMSIKTSDNNYIKVGYSL